MKLHTGETQFNATPDWSWEQRQTLGQRYLKDLAEDIIKLYERLPETDVSRFKSLAPSIDLNKLRFSAKPAHALVNRMKAQLELDGYLFREGILYKTESTVIDEQEEQSYLNLLIDSSLLNDPATIKHHVKLAEEHYVNGKWGDSIANSRNFLEAILVQVANAINVVKYGSNLSTDVAGRAVEVRTYLEKENVVEAKEKEAIGKVYGLLSDTGSHPNIAERDQARLMWHLALTFSQFVLLRYQGLLKKSGDVPA